MRRFTLVEMMNEAERLEVEAYRALGEARRLGDHAETEKLEDRIRECAEARDLLAEMREEVAS